MSFKKQEGYNMEKGRQSTEHQQQNEDVREKKITL